MLPAAADCFPENLPNLGSTQTLLHPTFLKTCVASVMISSKTDESLLSWSCDTSTDGANPSRPFTRSQAKELKALQAIVWKNDAWGTLCKTHSVIYNVWEACGIQEEGHGLQEVGGSKD